MKTRNGFVSNSSTSSFICDVCEREEMGMDIGLDECEMYSCVKEHIFCQDEAVNVTEDRDEIDGAYDVPAEHCPICQMAVFTSVDLAAYLERTTQITREEAYEKVKGFNFKQVSASCEEYVMYVLVKENKTAAAVIDEIKARFKSYDEFDEFTTKDKS